mmetsp:Transcript_2289/g.5919  ORF Transcript_2289/g.5919 Transcript_2289/m.5919 type:complete len:267 (-) Transcript_2289:38-838(-)
MGQWGLDDSLYTDPSQVYTVSVRPAAGWDDLWLPLALTCLVISIAFALRPAAGRGMTQIFYPTRFGTGLPPGKMYFRPSEAYQEVLPEHVIPNGLDLRMDMDSGKNFARFMPGQVDSAVSTYSDEATVVEKICEAATWDKPDKARQLLASCYWRTEALTKPLCEAAERGHQDVCEVLLRSRADPLGQGPRGVTALHRALGGGHERLASSLLGSCLQAGRRDALEVCDELGRTCLDVAREQDLGPAARRVEAAFGEMCAAHVEKGAA